MAAFAPRYDPPIPITTKASESLLIFSAEALIRVNSSLSYSFGRFTHPKNSFPGPVFSKVVFRANSVYCATFSSSCSDTIPIVLVKSNLSNAVHFLYLFDSFVVGHPLIGRFTAQPQLPPFLHVISE